MAGVSLPVIDIGPFMPGSQASAAERKRCLDDLAEACRDTGFFYLTNHGIPASETEDILDLARSFFLYASAEEKAAIARQDPGQGLGDGARGYQSVGENVTQGKRDWHEAIDLYREVEHGEPPYSLCRGPNRWPSTPAAMKERYSSYIQTLLALGEVVVRAMGLALDPSYGDVFAEHTRSSFWVMRVIGYPPSPDMAEASADGESGISCGEHTDYGCVTLLLADSTKGALQVKHRSGAWINADPIPGAFVVNIGDMMERWTNGLWKSTPHRVIHRSEAWRFSVPFFFEPDFDALIEPLALCVKATGGVRLYEKTQYGQHLLGKVGGNFYGAGATA